MSFVETGVGWEYDRSDLRCTFNIFKKPLRGITVLYYHSTIGISVTNAVLKTLVRNVFHHVRTTLIVTSINFYSTRLSLEKVILSCNKEKKCPYSKPRHNHQYYTREGRLEGCEHSIREKALPFHVYGHVTSRIETSLKLWSSCWIDLSENAFRQWLNSYCVSYKFCVLKHGKMKGLLMLSIFLIKVHTLITNLRNRKHKDLIPYSFMKRRFWMLSIFYQ